jgi:hypothetical protein
MMSTVAVPQPRRPAGRLMSNSRFSSHQTPSGAGRAIGIAARLGTGIDASEENEERSGTDARRIAGVSRRAA